MKILKSKFNNQYIIKMFSVIAIMISILFLNNCEASYQNFEKEARQNNIKYVVGEAAIKKWATFRDWRVSDYNALMTKLKEQQVELDRIIFYKGSIGDFLACRAKDDELFTVYDIDFEKNGNTITARISGGGSAPFGGPSLTIWANTDYVNAFKYKIDSFFYKLSSYENFIHNLANSDTEEYIKKNFEKDASNIRFERQDSGCINFYEAGYKSLGLHFTYKYDVELMSGKTTYTGTLYAAVDETGKILEESLSRPY